MNRSDDVTIAIVSYNSFQAISACLSELIDSRSFPVIIIDNASSDDTAERLEQRFPDSTLVKSPCNLGYGRAANLAMASCTTKYLFLINPDLKATTAEVKQLLLTFKQQNEKVALLAPAVEEKAHTKQGLVEQDWVIGAAMMFNMDAMKPVGGFDDKIFLFSEETDLCMRIQKAGLKILLDTDVYIEHLYRQSSTPNPKTEALKDWHQAWSFCYFHHKHHSDHGKYNPYRRAIRYFIKYVLATDQAKKQRYKYRLLGSYAYLKGQPAFLDSQQPYDPLESKKLRQ